MFALFLPPHLSGSALGGCGFLYTNGSLHDAGFLADIGALYSSGFLKFRGPLFSDGLLVGGAARLQGLGCNDVLALRYGTTVFFHEVARFRPMVF